MVLSDFTGVGVGFGFGVGCGFGVGWGFGGMPLNIFGIGADGLVKNRASSLRSSSSWSCFAIILCSFL